MTILNFGHRTTIGVSISTYLPGTGGTNQAAEISLVIPRDGNLTNLHWDCQSNGLTGIGNKFTIKVGALHATPTSAAPALTDALIVSIDGKTNGTAPFNFPVVAGQRVGVLVQTVAGGTTISRLRVSFDLETVASGGGSSVISESGGKIGIGLDPTRTPQEKLTLAPDSNLVTEMPTPSGVAAAASPASGGLPMDDYFFRVTASDGVGWTKASAQLVFNLSDPDHGVRISWNSVLGATKYRLYRALTLAGAYKYIEVTNTSYDYVSDAAFTLTAAPPEETTAYMNKLSATGTSSLLGGNLGIGTTTPLAQVGNGSLQNSLETRGWIVAKGNGANTWGDSATRIGVYAPGGSDNDGAWWFSANADHTFAIHQGGGGDRFNITQGGNIGIGTALPSEKLHVNGICFAGDFRTMSSKRWKTNIRTIKGALNKVKRLRGITYNQKDDDKRTIGLVAEEVGEVIPEIVSYDENGKDAQGLDYSRLVAVLIEAVKEQQGQIEELKETVKSLLADKGKAAGLA